MRHNDEWYERIIGRLNVKLEEKIELHRRDAEQISVLQNNLKELSESNGWKTMEIAALKAKLECGDECGDRPRDDMPESLLHRYERRIQDLTAGLDSLRSQYDELAFENDRLEIQLKELQNDVSDRRGRPAGFADMSESEQAAIRQSNSIGGG